MRKVLLVSVLLLWGVVLGIVVRGIVLNAEFLHDDAFITLRYAQNWLAGNGIAWNPGDRVEGYTNFLQLLAVSGLGAAGIDLIVATRAVAAVALGALVLCLLPWLRARAGEGRGLLGAVACSLPLAACIASLPLIAWGFGGLEAPLLAACVTIGVALLADVRETNRPVRRAFGGGFALALACLTRPDAGLFAAAAAVLVGWPVAGRVRWRIALAFAAPLVLLLVPWLAWKLAYYGTLVPNTFYVKATDPSLHRLQLGLRYVGSFAAAPPFLLPLVVVAAARAVTARRMTAGQGFGLAVVAMHLAWVVYVGGDQMPMVRLLVPILPLVALLCFDLWLPDLLRVSVVGMATIAGALAIALGLQFSVPALAAPNRNSTAFVGSAVGDYIAAHWRRGSLVALNTAGSTPYHAPAFRYIDMLGLNDAHIARRVAPPLRARGQLLPGHAKGDGAYVLGREPDYIILGPAHGALAHQPWFLSDVEIVEDRRFLARYVRKHARIDVTQRRGFASFPEAAGGEIPFTWYERKSRDALESPSAGS